MPAEVNERLQGLLEDESRVTGGTADRLTEEEDREGFTLAFSRGQ